MVSGFGIELFGKGKEGRCWKFMVADLLSHYARWFAMNNWNCLNIFSGLLESGDFEA